MSQRTLRARAVSIAAAAAIAGGGLAVVPTVTAGTAAAAECKQEATVEKNLVVKYRYLASVPAQAAQGRTVTYSVSMAVDSGFAAPYVQNVWNQPPTQLKGVKPTVKVKAYTLVGGILGGAGALGNLIQESSVDPGGVVNDKGWWKISHQGWAVKASQSLTAEFTYVLPASIKPGAQLTSPNSAVHATPNPPNGYVEIGAVCTTVRAPNAGEAALGSLDKNGLGSAEGQLSSTGSLTDIIPGVIGGIAGGGGDEKEK